MLIGNCTLREMNDQRTKLDRITEQKLGLIPISFFFEVQYRLTMIYWKPITSTCKFFSKNGKSSSIASENYTENTDIAILLNQTSVVSDYI